MKKNIKNSIFFILFPFLLILIGILFALQFYPKAASSVLSYPHSQNNFSDWKDRPLFQGDKVSAIFTGQENGLGIVSVRFITFKRINNDSLIFRIKENGAKRWYYEGQYKVDQFQPNQLFTFGFPRIQDSKDKQYVFEIESTKGKKNDAVAVSTTEPVFVSQYQFLKSEILQANLSIIKFLAKKIYSSFLDRDFYFYSLIYAFPFFIIYLNFFKKWKQSSLVQSLVLVLFIVQVIISSLFIQILAIVIPLGIAWLLILYVFNFDSRKSFFMGLISFVLFILMLFISSLIKNYEAGNYAGRLAIWAYYFFLVGLLQLIKEK